jgi:hypothetical protein
MIPPRLRKISTLLVWLLAAAAGAGAVLIADRQPSPPLEPFGQDWAINPQSYPYAITTKGLALPFPFADFDLYLNLQLILDDELDIVCRLVHPVVTASSGAPFHARFSLLRLSAVAEGPPYRTREQALFEDIAGGARVVPNRVTTVVVQGRGHSIRANVGGTWLPWFQTDDDRGQIELLPRRGPVELSLLSLVRIPRDPPLPAWSIGAALALLGAIVAQLARASALRALAFAVLLPLGGWLGHALVLSSLVPLAAPTPAGLSWAALVGLPAAVFVCMRRPLWLWSALGVIAAVAALEVAARVEHRRLEPLADPRLSLFFGEASGPAPIDALAGRIPNRTAVFNLEPPLRPAIMFLGGRALFDAHADFAESVGLLSALRASQELGVKLDGIVLPTAFSHALQQLLLFRRFYLDFAPRVVVFGLTRYEGVAGERRRARAVLEDIAARRPARGFSALLDLLRNRDRGAEPIATPADLRLVLQELHELSEQRGFRVVLASESGVAPELLAVLDAFASERSLRLVRDVLTEDGRPNVDELVAALIAAW